MKVDIQIAKGFNKADSRFISFLRGATMPVTESQIIAFYRKRVADEALVRFTRVWDEKKREYQYNQYDRSNREIRLQALAWFDRSLGRVIRKQILLIDPVKLLLQP